MKKFSTKSELIEAKALAMHAANLERGGVFDDNGDRTSRLANERMAATSKVIWVAPHYASALRKPAGWVIDGFGYATP